MNFWVPPALRNCDEPDDAEAEALSPAAAPSPAASPVSYTHLTLPTKA